MVSCSHTCRRGFKRIFSLVCVKVRACLVSRATRRAEKRSVSRRSAFGSPRAACGNAGVGMADDGPWPLPPYAYASFILRGGCPRHDS
nr:DNA helicase UvrD [Thioalkalivibrio paradoxus]